MAFSTATFLAALVLLTSLFASALGTGIRPSGDSSASSPTRRVRRYSPNAVGPASAGSPKYPKGKGISYWGGPIMYKPIKVYFVWLGYISKSRKDYVKNFVRSLSPSNSSKNTVQNWWKIATLYTDDHGRNVSSHISIGGEMDILDFNNVIQMAYDPGLPYDNFTEWQLSDLRGSFGNFPAQGGVYGVVEGALLQQLLPYDVNGIYVVFSNGSVWQGDYGSGMCNSFCGWHNYAPEWSPQGKVAFKYAWIGIPADQQGGCYGCEFSFDPHIAPADDPDVALTVSVLAHELAETVTDPLPNSGWVQYRYGTGEENGDLCAWNFGRTHVSSTDVLYNLVGLGGAQYFVQQLWNPLTGSCELSPSI